ncbi:hypothetical protein LTR56_027174 [Elasticomyces elasticus]|nr:hypothetical protein LTR56_027174 [Elasticomyces elasticus]KAK3659674.1 hypothetical protein LTR22_008405 [Elasticomyces elasticus]KAK4916897.1 hypothetical protein LTR49_015209 [Elasticomyces elasticus]KAK5747597.1 hypothetical protein LTS12_022334 [Elasticomyces elasticus]
MATLSAPISRPKKLIRYGKATSRTTSSSQWLGDEEDELAGPQPAPSTLKESYTVHKAGGSKRVEKPEANKQEVRVADVNKVKVKKVETTKPEAKKAEAKKSEVKRPAVVKQTTVSKHVKAMPKEVDAFDVPSSDDECRTEFTLTRLSPKAVTTKRSLVKDVPKQTAEMAPWEKAKVSPKPMPQPRSMGREEQRNVPVRMSDKPTLSRKASTDSGLKADTAQPTRIAKEDSQPMTAAARLKLRREQANGAAPAARSMPVMTKAAPNKRAGAITPDVDDLSPRKRARTSPAENSELNEALTPNALSTTACDLSPPKIDASAMEVDVYALPDDPADYASSKTSPTAINKVKPIRPRRTKASSSPLPTAKKGLSAPARLTEMLPPDNNTNSPTSRSPSVLRSRPSTPRREATPAQIAPPSTPPAGIASSPRPTSKAPGSATPRQAELWKNLLPAEPVASTPSSLAIKELTLSGQRRGNGAGLSTRPRMLMKSSSDVTGMSPKRTRLVDRLKASMPEDDDDSSDEDEDEDDEMDDVTEVVTTVKVPLKAGDDDESTNRQSQSQSAAAETGPKITYARIRSYLPEDNLEDVLLFDLPTMTPARPAAMSRENSKTNLESQKTTFDLDESEEEGVSGKMRTIHDLRAAGRNHAFMQETEGLLDDIADHSTSGRSRRRGALIELATKLMDKGYVARFASQGFEHKLIAELTAEPDAIADFVLAVCLAFLLVGEPPEHSVHTLKEGGLITWLTGMLSNEVEVSKLAKDRKNNMSKAAQETLVKFAGSVRSQESLWSEQKPAHITSRIVALKALDLLVGRLRRSGDRAELLDMAQLELVMPPMVPKAKPAPVDSSLAISVLEALSISGQTLSWPADLVERLAVQLPTLAESPGVPSHTVFLALRLALNLTNDNDKNCEVYARVEVVQYLLSTIETGFAALDAATPSTDANADEEQQSALAYDLLVLALGCAINLFEHSENARMRAVPSKGPAVLQSLIETLMYARDRMEDAESLSEMSNNVALGYLAVALANLCQSAETRAFIGSRLPLTTLVSAVGEFITHHSKVDSHSQDFAGAEGGEIWSSFTSKLREVLKKLEEVA